MAEEPPKLETDDVILASSPTAILTQSPRGSLTLWRLEWRDRGTFPPGMTADAWQKYLKAQIE